MNQNAYDPADQGDHRASGGWNTASGRCYTAAKQVLSGSWVGEIPPEVQQFVDQMTGFPV
jgi:hypothetical protein